MTPQEQELNRGAAATNHFRDIRRTPGWCASMRDMGFILILIVALFGALFLGVLASIHLASIAAAELQLATRDQSTGPYNPNQPPERARRRGA